MSATLNRLFIILVVLAVLPVGALAETRKPVVAILATGGTIAGGAESKTATIGYKPAVFGVEKLLADVPSLSQVATIRAEQVFQMASENMTPEHWLTLNKRIMQLLREPDVSGVVITHGTDTIEETAYFLNLTVKSDKPVVITGAMRPATAISADGPLNLHNAVCLAASREAKGKGVLILLNDEILAARETTKANTFTTDTFRSPDLGILGYMQLGKALFYRQTSRTHTQNSEFAAEKLTTLPRVDILYGYAGSDRKQVEAAVAAGAKGIVFAGTGNGSLSDEMKKALSEARAKGVLIVRSSRTGSGPVTRNGEVNDDALDFIAADNLNPQKARILLALALALTGTNQTALIQKMFHTY